MSRKYRVEQYFTTGWSIVDKDAIKLSKDEAKKILENLMKEGVNPNELRAIPDQQMYEPQIDDYVRWTDELGTVLEGWVYFKCDPKPKKRGFPKHEHYITIEIGVKDMPYEQQKGSLHKKTHVLLLCYHTHWHQLEYIKNRRDSIDVQMYHSQEGRYADVQ